jgi:hypothetical protein
MPAYIAQTIDFPPYIDFCQLHTANDLDIAEQRNLPVFMLDELPQIKYGSYVVKLVDNALIPLTDVEIFDLKASYDAEMHKISTIKCDKVISAAISNGFEFDSNIFSLSANAQLNWNRILNLSALGCYTDSIVSTKSGKYLLTSDNVIAFAKAYHEAIQNAQSIR